MHLRQRIEPFLFLVCWNLFPPIKLQVVVCFAESHELAFGEGGSQDYQSRGALGWGGEEGRHAPAASLLPLPVLSQATRPLWLQGREEAAGLQRRFR